MGQQEERALVFKAVEAAWNAFVHDARKQDKELSESTLRELVKNRVVRKAEIAAYWHELVRNWDVPGR